MHGLNIHTRTDMLALTFAFLFCLQGVMTIANIHKIVSISFCVSRRWRKFHSIYNTSPSLHMLPDTEDTSILFKKQICWFNWNWHLIDIFIPCHFILKTWIRIFLRGRLFRPGYTVRLWWLGRVTHFSLVKIYIRYSLRGE